VIRLWEGGSRVRGGVCGGLEWARAQCERGSLKKRY